MSNAYGSYGSQYSATSIFNQYSVYGSPYSAQSPFNQYTATPPIILNGDTAVDYLTVNTFKTPRLDPNAVIAWMKGN